MMLKWQNSTVLFCVSVRLKFVEVTLKFVGSLQDPSSVAFYLYGVLALNTLGHTEVMVQVVSLRLL